MPRKSLTLAVTLLSALCTMPTLAADSAVRWQSDIDAALATAAQTNRLVLVHFWGSQCGPCLRLDATVFKDQQFAAVLEAEYVPVKVNVDQFPVTAQRYGIRVMPTDVILTPDGKVAATTQCPADGVAYAQRLRETAATIRRSNAQFAQADRRPTNNDNRYDAPRDTVASYAPRETDGRPNVSAVEQQAPSRGSDESDRRYANDFSAPQARDRADPQVASRADAYAGVNAQENVAAAAPRMTAREVPAAKSAGDEKKNALPYGNAGGTNAAASYAQPAVTPSVPNNAPTSAPSELCMDGCCPVTLMDTEKMVPGDRRFGATHRGRLYLFTSAAAQQRFLAEPDRYSPAISGHDTVIWVEQGKLTRGDAKFGGYYHGYVYLFSTEATLRQFEANPDRYAIPAEKALTAGRGQGQVRR